MNKSQKSQIAKICLIALLFLITPLLPTSMRPPYLYFLLNLLIIALGAEAGLLSFLNPSKEKKLVFVAPKPIAIPSVASSSPHAAPVKEAGHHDAVGGSPKNINGNESSQLGTETKKVIKVMEKTISEKIVSTVTNTVTVHNLKKCPSMPSLFFIGSGGGEDIDHAEEREEEEEEEMEGIVLTGQELFTKAETFIGNFYQQLKMQREESWKSIHGFYQRAF